MIGHHARIYVIEETLQPEIVLTPDRELADVARIQPDAACRLRDADRSDHPVEPLEPVRSATVHGTA
jgi:hypothetical protein